MTDVELENIATHRIWVWLSRPFFIMTSSQPTRPWLVLKNAPYMVKGTGK